MSVSQDMRITNVLEKINRSRVRQPSLSQVSLSQSLSNHSRYSQSIVSDKMGRQASSKEMPFIRGWDMESGQQEMRCQYPFTQRSFSPVSLSCGAMPSVARIIRKTYNQCNSTCESQTDDTRIIDDILFEVVKTKFEDSNSEKQLQLEHLITSKVSEILYTANTHLNIIKETYKGQLKRKYKEVYKSLYKKKFNKIKDKNTIRILLEKKKRESLIVQLQNERVTRRNDLENVKQRISLMKIKYNKTVEGVNNYKDILQKKDMVLNRIKIQRDKSIISLKRILDLNELNDIYTKCSNKNKKDNKKGEKRIINLNELNDLSFIREEEEERQIINESEIQDVKPKQKQKRIRRSGVQILLDEQKEKELRIRLHD